MTSRGFDVFATTPPSRLYTEPSLSASVAANVVPPVASAMLASVARSGRHGDGDEPVAAVDRDGSGQRPERDRVDGDVRLLRETGTVLRREHTSGLGAVRKEHDGAERLLARRLRPAAAGLARRQADDFDSARNSVADRRPEAGRQRVDPVLDQPPVGGRRRDDDRVVREGDEADLDLPGHAVDEGSDRPAGGLEPTRQHVLRVHRHRDVDDEDDRGAIRGRRQRDPRPGDRDAEEGDRREEEAREDVAPHSTGP